LEVILSQQTHLNALQWQAQQFSQRAASLTLLSRRYSWIRLGVFIAGAVFTVLAFNQFGTTAGLGVLVISLIVLGIWIYLHRRINRTINDFDLWREIKLTHVARMQLDWSNIPQATKYEPRPTHPFEADLDLTGSRSVHHLLDTATSREGSQQLRAWITEINPELAGIQNRQAIVQELARLPYFRDKLLFYSTLTLQTLGRQWSSKDILNWLASSKDLPSLRNPLIALIILAVCNMVLFTLNNMGLIPPLWVITFVPYAALSLSKILRIGGLFENALALGELLGTLKTVFSYLERYPYTGKPYLQTLCAPFLLNDDRPSKHLRRVSRVMSAASLQRTQMLWLVVNAVVPWDIFVAYRLDQLKAELSSALPAWLKVWHELEALNSLANFAYLNPDYNFPELVPPDDQRVILDAEGLGHPLLPREAKISNDFHMETIGDVVIVTGSNMSGKSSFLRTVGVNLCLANAGGPVNAAKFQSQLFRLFTCIKVSDSVTDGISYFYAEVKRLKALLSALETPDERPLFFMIDEIFRGTNNRERLIGSRAYVRALAGKNGVGIVSTHDLELVTLAESIPQISNYHFEDSIVDGRMIFDYRLRQGPSPTTNALRIMEIEGLPTDGA
jgi:hypothetical protein